MVPNYLTFSRVNISAEIMIKYQLLRLTHTGGELFES